jgi:excisionase family DNA binding protein
MPDLALKFDFSAEKKPLSVNQVAELFEVHPGTVRRWMIRGLEFSKFGGQLRTNLEAVNRFQTGGKPAASPPIAVPMDKRTLEAVKKLRKRGIPMAGWPKAGANDYSNGRSQKTG